MFVSIAVGFGYVFYLPTTRWRLFFVVLFFLGVGGANFAIYTLWLPEQYATECRASAFAFATSVGRFVGAGITFLVGAGVTLLPHHRHAGRADLDRVPRRPAAAAVRRRDARQDAAA